MFNNEVIFESLKVMGFGMLGIFVFMTVFYLIIVALNKLMPPKPDGSDKA